MRFGPLLPLIFILFCLIFAALSSARRPPKAFTRTKYTAVDTHRSQHKSKLFHEVKQHNKHIKIRKTNRRLVQSERQLKYSAKFVPSSEEEEDEKENRKKHGKNEFVADE